MKVSVAVVAVLLVACIATASAARRKNKNKNKGCRYDRGTWSACDAATNTRTLTKTLQGDTPGCEPTKIKTKACPTKCKYSKSGQWSECDADNKRHMTQTLNREKSGSNCPETKVKTKTCRANTRPAKGCKYGKMQWSQCAGGTRTGTRTLVQGAPECQQEISKTRKCR